MAPSSPTVEAAIPTAAPKGISLRLTDIIMYIQAFMPGSMSLSAQFLLQALYMTGLFADNVTGSPVSTAHCADTAGTSLP